MTQGSSTRCLRIDTPHPRGPIDRGPRRILAIAAIICAALPIMAPAAAHGSKDIYADVVRRVERLSGRNGVVVERIGESREGRPLMAVILTDEDGAEAISANPTRLLVLCGQHGDEKAPVYSTLSLMESIANGRAKTLKESLRRTVVAFVPVVNPDGFAASSRQNASGVDLNRDWVARGQPESQAVCRLVVRFRPHVLIDLHQWTSRDPYRRNCLETPGFGNRAEYRLARLLAHKLAGNSPFDPAQYHAQSDQRLAHRYFTNQGICSMLAETSPQLGRLARAGAYRTLVETALTTLARPDQSRISDELTALRNARQPANPWLADLYSRQHNSSATFARTTSPCRSQIVACCCCLALAWLSRPRRVRVPKIPIDWKRGEIPRRRPFALTEVIQSDLPIRDRIEFMREYRLRPTDRPQAAKAA